MIQEIITYIIIVLAFGKAIYGIFSFLFTKKTKADCGCGGGKACASNDWKQVSERSKLYVKKMNNLA